MILLFTDFGHRASYMGQMTAVLTRAVPATPVVTLTAHAPAFDPYRSAYLLAAEAHIARPGDVVVAVVDPGVGTDRAPLAVEVDGVWYIGPDNGLTTLVARRGRSVRPHRITWRPDELSASFHGRDLFAPVAARLATGDRAALTPTAPSPIGTDWPDELDEVVFVDDYGNAMTGRRARTLDADACLETPGSEPFRRLRTFADDRAASGFWYTNAIGLAEISVREGSAAERFGLAIGTPATPRALPAT